MIGEKVRRGDVKLKFKFDQGVEADNTFESVTLIPNIGKLKINKQ